MAGADGRDASTALRREPDSVLNLGDGLGPDVELGKGGVGSRPGVVEVGRRGAEGRGVGGWVEEEGANVWWEVGEGRGGGRGGRHGGRGSKLCTARNGGRGCK